MKSIWTNRKHPKKKFTSEYRYRRGDRSFILSHRQGGKTREISFESHEAAKTLGWKRTVIAMLLLTLTILTGCGKAKEITSDDMTKKPDKFFNCSTLTEAGDPKPNDLTAGWKKERGTIPGIRAASYVVFTPPNAIPGKFLYLTHGLCNSGNLEASRWDQHELREVINTLRVPIIAVTYGESWILTKHDTNAHDSTVSKFVGKVMPYIEATHGLVGDRFILGHSMGGVNAGTLCTLHPELFKGCVLTNPMIFECDPSEGLLGCPTGLVVNGSALGLPSYFTEEQWEKENLHYLLANSTKPLPPTYVSACPEDEHDLYGGTKIWIGIAKMRKDDIKFKTLGAGCDHNSVPPSAEIIAALTKKVQP